MAVERWTDGKEVGKRLAAHRLTGLLSVDLEGSGSIGAIGAIRTDRSSTFTWRGDNGTLRAALVALDQFADGASYLVGRNVIAHDLELLAKHAPDLSLLNLPAIDTLYLSLLAFPENPYHHLVKQYQEPALARVQVNDPLLDAELTSEGALEQRLARDEQVDPRRLRRHRNEPRAADGDRERAHSAQRKHDYRADCQGERFDQKA